MADADRLVAALNYLQEQKPADPLESFRSLAGLRDAYERRVQPIINNARQTFSTGGAMGDLLRSYGEAAAPGNAAALQGMGIPFKGPMTAPREEGFSSGENFRPMGDPQQQFAGQLLGDPMNVQPMIAPAARGAVAAGKYAGPELARGLENYMGRTGMMLNAAPQEKALRLAEQRAVEKGQSVNPLERSLQQGFEHGWYHGSTGDITNFRPDLLGEATGAASAKKGFFFARDPQNPPAAMMQKTTDQSSIDMLKKLGIPDEEIAKLNTVSMQGHGAETASGYAQIGGSREYREATRKAKSAEKRKDWNEYEKQSQIAENAEINRMNYLQSLTAKHGDARDAMLDAIQKTVFNKTLPQAESILLDEKYKQLFPSGWYNFYNDAQFKNAKNQLANMVGEKSAKPALQKINKYQSVSNERRLAEHTQEGGNVMPVALSYKNPLVHDFGGNAYREQTYSDLIDKALANKNDALILKNTFDPGAGASKLIDVGVMFNPEQVRSKFAAFDPFRRNSALAAALGVAAPDLLAQENK